MALLELQDVVATYGSRRALHGVSLNVEEGSIVAMLGANGAGKTTTLRAITGLVKVQGAIRFDGHRITGRPTEEIARLGIAHVPEGRGTMSQLSVLENLQMGACLRRDGKAVRQDLDRVYAYFPWMKNRLEQPAALLSGGEQQMLAIARAAMMRPRLLLLDEPSLGLAPIVVKGIFKIIETINSEQGVTIILVEQNARIALKTAHRAYVLEVGAVAVSGLARELAQDESVRKSYLGY
ncbi:MAG TPA: ABC transporter ATP-binding protein [Candidatus Dormibacteraeota bacterium]|nr:ABC transporter ATP-binding protein [Candidatus Dormibacteraeota bacterium]